MSPRSYTLAPFPGETVEDYLKRLLRQGFTAPAAVAHLVRERREGYVELRPAIADSSHILIEPDGRVFVETANGPPIPARDYTCHVRTRGERADYLHGVLTGQPPREHAVQGGDEAEAPAPTGRRARRLRELMARLKTPGEVKAVEWQAPRLTETSKVDDDKAECMRLFKISERGYEERVLPAARVSRGWPEKLPGQKRKLNNRT